MSVKLGVNIDHVATVRQARCAGYPEITEAADAAIKGGADGITVHLREDRRHIQDEDLYRLKQLISVPLNLEMAPTEEMLTIAQEIMPTYCCLVPEKRHELTTEGGLDVVNQVGTLRPYCQALADVGIQVSLFIDVSIASIDAAIVIGVPIIELHTGIYADSKAESKNEALQHIIDAAAYAQDQGLIVNAGHGLTLENVKPIATIKGMNELNIGHSIVARALMVGMQGAVAEMKVAIDTP